MTEFFAEDSEESFNLNFLYQININGVLILDYLQEYLQTLPIFNDCIVKISSNNVYIDIVGLKNDPKYDFPVFSHNDRIIKFNLSDHEYIILSNESIQRYKNIMEKSYELKIEEINDYWKQFEDLSLKSRLKKSIQSLADGKCISSKISNFCFWLYAPVMKKKINEKLKDIYEKIEICNLYLKEQYEEDIIRQKYYLNCAPAQIMKIQQKQNDILGYLKDLGYVENNKMSKY